MDPITVRQKLIDVLGQVQADSGLECPPLTGATKPVVSMPKFDSKIWPVATTILATEVDMPIPNDVNIFVDETSKSPRSIDEIVAFICALEKEQAEKGAASA